MAYSRYNDDYLSRPTRTTGSRTGSNRSSQSGSPYGSRRGSRDNLLDNRDSSPDSDYGSDNKSSFRSRKTSLYRDSRSFSIVLDDLEIQLRKIEDESHTLTHDFTVIRNQHQNQTRRIQDLQRSFEEARFTLTRISRRTYAGDADSPDVSEKSERSSSFRSSDRAGSVRSSDRSGSVRSFDRSDRESFKSSDYTPKAERTSTSIRVVVRSDA